MSLLTGTNTEKKAWGSPYAFFFIFGICLATRLLTAIYYIEDPDSLRFALGIQDYNLSELRPHFPGYPVFCWLTQLVYLISHSLGFSFALMGGLATFGVIFFSIRIAERLRLPAHPGLIAALLLVNPLIWLMGNRYMPDLMGLAVLLGAVWLFLCAWEKPTNPAGIGFFLLAGLLPGVRLSYLPFLLIPVIVLLIRNPRKSWWALFGVLGVAIWLVPMIVVTGWNALIEVAQTHTQGHFGDWGGTVGTDPDYPGRFWMMLETIWADGMGGWMPGRNWLTGILSFFLGLTGLYGVWQMIRNRNEQQVPTGKNPQYRPFLWLAAALLLYAIWIYFFQNVLYKSRHILPFLPFLNLAIASVIPGKSELISEKRIRGIGLGLVFAVLIPMSLISLQLVRQHQQPSAIAQSQAFLQERNKQPGVFISIPLINYYLATHSASNLSFFELNDAEAGIEKARQTGMPLWSNRKLDGLVGKPPTSTHTFYHNPYVNRLWPVITLYEY